MRGPRECVLRCVRCRARQRRVILRACLPRCRSLPSTILAPSLTPSASLVLLPPPPMARAYKRRLLAFVSRRHVARVTTHTLCRVHVRSMRRRHGRASPALALYGRRIDIVRYCCREQRSCRQSPRGSLPQYDISAPSRRENHCWRYAPTLPSVCCNARQCAMPPDAPRLARFTLIERRACRGVGWGSTQREVARVEGRNEEDEVDSACLMRVCRDYRCSFSFKCCGPGIRWHGTDKGSRTGVDRGYSR